MVQITLRHLACSPRFPKEGDMLDEILLYGSNNGYSITNILGNLIVGLLSINKTSQFLSSYVHVSWRKGRMTNCRCLSLVFFLKLHLIITKMLYARCTLHMVVPNLSATFLIPLVVDDKRKSRILHCQQQHQGSLNIRLCQH